MRTVIAELARQPVPAAVYNDLPILGQANDHLRANGLIDKMQRCVEDIFVRHEMHEHWAIYILHHHWKVLDGEIAAEVMKSPDAYLMRPVPAGSIGSYVPSLLGIRGGTFQALEFSSTPQALESYALLLKNEAFVHELEAALIQNNLAPHFGLGAIRLPEQENCSWVEFTQPDRGSLMRQTPIGSVSENDVVQTSWMFGPRRPMSCWKHFSCYSPGGAHAD